MRILERQRVDGVGRLRGEQILALAIGAAQHRVYQLARAESVAALRQFHRLRDRSVRGNASHEQQLVHTKSQQVDDIRIEPNQSAPHALGENRIDGGAVTEHSINELPRPATIACVEWNDATIERLIEKFTATQIDTNLGGYRSCGSNSAGRRNGGVHEPSIPVVGEDGTATSRFGMRPAR